MFASKNERKVHYSIRKFSVGVASELLPVFLWEVLYMRQREREVPQ